MPSIESLLGALDLEEVGEGRYRARSAENPQPVVFGGQLLAQSLLAAGRSEPDKRILTIHTAFARGAKPDTPLDIAVDEVNSGRTFSSRTVTIAQGGRICTRSQVLLTADEPDFVRHADPAPAIGPPSGVEHGEDAFDISIVGDVDISDPALVGPPDLDVWIRVPDAPADPAVEQALLAYITDGFLIATAMRPHEGVGQAQAHVTVATSVVSHTLTFHEPVSVRDWLLLAQHSDHAGRGRGHGRAAVFDTAGTLVASFVQDSLLRSAG